MPYCLELACWQKAPCAAHGRLSAFGEPFWHTLLPNGHPVHIRGDVPAFVETIVIGCGLTGAACAFSLAQLGRSDVLVLDARGIGDGATGRNGGHQWPSSEKDVGTDDSDLRKLQMTEIARFLAEVGVREENIPDSRWARVNLLRERVNAAVAAGTHPELAKYARTFTSAANLEQKDAAAVRELVARLPAEDQKRIELQVTGGAALTFDEQQLERFESQGGFLDAAALMKDGSCRSSSVLGGVIHPNAGQLVPARLVLSLVERAQEKGVRFVTNQRVMRIEQQQDEKDGCWEVTTNQGVRVRCRFIVHATNGYDQSLLPPRVARHLQPVRGQILAVAAPPLQAPRSLGYHSGPLPSADRYLIQRRSDGVVILGGCRFASPTLGLDADDGVVETKVHAELLESYRTLFQPSDSPHVTHAWGGTMCFTDDGRPVVGQLRERPGQYIAVGYCGHGMVRAFSCGRHLAEMIAGHPFSAPEIGDLFSVDRFE